MLTLPTNVIEIQSKHSNHIRLRFASGCETSICDLHITDGSQCDHFHSVHSHLWLSGSHNNALTQIKLMLLRQKAFLITYQSKQMSSYHDQSSAAKYKGLPQTSHKPVSKRRLRKHVNRKLHRSALTNQTKSLSEVKPIQPQTSAAAGRHTQNVGRNNSLQRHRAHHHHTSEGPQNEMHGATVSRRALDTAGDGG